MYQVLVICTGNTCRSPMAEAILRSLLGNDLASVDQYRDTYNRIRSHLLGWVPVIRESVERREGVRRSSES